ncbi:uncharacterized protein [Antedon mediterranea]|uniref:uncharacterized protein n=1 Tax=Antedon mediterranea TaxID=105859 RepID=UPI003AF84852
MAVPASSIWLLCWLRWTLDERSPWSMLGPAKGALNSPGLVQMNFPREVKLRKRGKGGGIRKRLRKRKSKPPLPSMILGNVRSLSNKIDELRACSKHMFEYREASVMCFIETWLNNNIIDSELVLSNFELARADRTVESGKKRGGGVCFYINKAWCSNWRIREQLCTPDIELLTISARPFYLPREFFLIFLTVCYIHPNANIDNASETISSTVHRYETMAPDAPQIILGDFNKCTLKDVLPTYEQAISVETRGSATLDLCYCNVKNAYTSKICSKLGNSDHNNIHIMPKYKTKLKQSKPVVIQQQLWSTEVVEKLRGCLACTDWDIMLDVDDTLDVRVSTISAYISFCVDMVIPKVTKKIYANEKPWISNQLRKLLQDKRIAHRGKDTPKILVTKNENEDTEIRENETSLVNNAVINVVDVRNVFAKVKPGKSTGPDGIGNRVIKYCNQELAPIYTKLFNESLASGTVPNQWKTACISPIPKIKNPKELNDYRPIAITSNVGKCLEKIVLRQLLDQTKLFLDPLQFAYQSNRSVEDAVLFHLHNIYQHLDVPKSYVRCLYIDFSSAFNTVEPGSLVRKLKEMNVNDTLTSWIYNFLTKRFQYVKLNGILSDKRTVSIGTPQGSVISPMLFSLFTSSFRANSNECCIVKYADDTVITGYITGNDETSYRQLGCDFYHWWYLFDYATILYSK